MRTSPDGLPTDEDPVKGSEGQATSAVRSYQQASFCHVSSSSIVLQGGLDLLGEDLAPGLGVVDRDRSEELAGTAWVTLRVERRVPSR